MQLTPQHLKSLATPQSYERGEAIRVEKLVKRGEVYEGELLGTYRYRQTIDLRNEPMVATCSCPYEGTGICKHIVAVGLAIIEDAFTEMEELEEASETASFESIKEIREGIRPRIQAITLDPNTSDAGFGLDAAYADAMREKCERELQQAIAPYGERMKARLQKGQVFDAFKLLLGMYEGQVNLDGPAYVGYHILFDFNQLKEDVYDPYVEAFLSAVKESSLSFPVKRQMIELLFERWRRYEGKYQNREEEIRYDLEEYVEILLALLTDGVTAHFLKTRLGGYALYGEPFTVLHKRIAEFE